MALKTSKKKNTRMRRTIRKSIAGLCMISAIIVACIPPRESSAYIAPGDQGTNYKYGIEETDLTPSATTSDRLYSNGVDLSLYKDGVFNKTGSLTDASPDVYKILKVSQLSDGTYTMNWQFKLYLQDVSGVAMGVICQYNSTYAAGVVSILPAMPYEYLTIDESEYVKFYDSFKDAFDNKTETASVEKKKAGGGTENIDMVARYSSKYSDYEANPTNLDDEYWLNKYFKDSFNQYLNSFAVYEKYLADKAAWDTYVIEKSLYDAYVINYNNWVAGGSIGIEPTPVPEPAFVPEPAVVNEPSLTMYVHDMSNASKLEYFCEVHPDYNDSTTSLKGYKLVEVADYSNGSSSLSMPKVYMPKGEPNKDFAKKSDLSGDPVNYNDDMGFRIKNKCLVIAIGENAFRETTNVDKLDICGEIKYVGDNAFRDSFVRSVTFENIRNIGNRAFKGCSRLEKIDLIDGAVNIGTEAFYGCKINSILLPYSIEYIGPGAFANCTKLSTLDLSLLNRDGAIIEDFAFYDDISLSDVSLSDAIEYVGDCAFACSKGVSGSLSEFKFPDHISEDGAIGNFVLAGRTNLQYVYMPADYGKNSEVTLPYGVFFNCIALKCVEFPAVGGACGYVTFGKYTSTDPGRTIFDTIQTKDFYVRGPEKNMVGAIAYPRKSTWGLKTNLGNDVPYIYVDSEGNEQFEISNGNYILIIDDYGVLQSCTLADPSVTTFDLTIPSKVGDTKVTGVASDCFADEDIHNKIKTLVIADDSLSEIAPNAFKECENLERVSIGNSVTKIGDSAFEGCKKLTYVNFETPKNGYASFPMENIGKNAFSTGADALTFEGDIDEAYGPFKWAMQYDNYVDEENGVRVCYSTGYPTYLTVLVDNRNGLPTLVDYPHFEQVDKLSGTEGDEHPLSERYINLGSTYLTDVSGNMVEEVYSITLQEERLVNSALNLEVPNGIKSIDAFGYMNNSSKADESITGIHTNTNNVYKYMLATDYYDQYKQYGLFRGYYGTYTDSEGNKREYSANDNKEKISLGNDFINSITLNSVEYIPDRAFESCEQLTSVNLGAGCKEIGVAPFIGDFNMTGLASSSDRYLTQNGIIYEVKPDGTYKIKEVLASRGTLVGSSKVKISEDDPLLSNVSELDTSAFEGCSGVTGVDLTGMDLITEISDRCFSSCDRLGQIIIPDNITLCGHEAFSDVMEGTQVVFYGKEVYLPNDSFKGVDQFRVVSYKDSAVRKAARDLGADVSEVLDDTVRVQFFDYDGSPLSDIIFVVEGGNLDITVIPEDPVRKGYVFTGWDKPLTNITGDTFIFATYKVGNGTDNPDNPDNPDDPDGPSYSGSGTGSKSDTTSTSKKKTSTSTSKKKDSTSTSDSGSGSGSGGGGGTDEPESKAFYTLTVSNGNGSGSYKAGATVIISCTTAPAGKVFDKWVPETNDLGIASVTTSATTMVMPAHNAAVGATFKDAGSQTSTSTTTSTSATSTSKKKNDSDDEGTKVIVSKPGISNTGLASATVTGSPDDYVIRITETQAATEAVERALLSEYGSLDNVRYSAMDISLYDSTGSSRITDYSGLSITITIPVPDVLTAYAGNNKVAGVVNEQLDKLNPKFTSIDGVPCITFTATHFSPYTIYADVANLSDSTIDETPKTGDGISPKWFLSLGLAALSIALFFMKDKKSSANMRLA